MALKCLKIVGNAKTKSKKIKIYDAKLKRLQLQSNKASNINNTLVGKKFKSTW